MEAGGAASACFQAKTAPGFLMVRCVSDLADEQKDSATDGKWRPYACEVAAAYAIGLLQSGPVVPLDPVDPSLKVERGAAGHKLALSNLPERNPFFTGREDVLAQLQEALARQGRVALSGLGGVGKTQTAVEYAHRHQEEYVYKFFATAHSREAIVSGYTTIAGLLKLSLANAQDQTLAVNAVKHWLSSYKEWLLILDNADDLAMVREFIPSGNNGH